MLHQKIIRATKTTADVECLGCRNTQTVELDSRGEPDIDTVPCADDSCLARLCEHCDMFVCDHCHLPHCTSHRVRVGEDELCAVCTRGYVADAIAEFAEIGEEEAA